MKSLPLPDFINLAANLPEDLEVLPQEVRSEFVSAALKFGSSRRQFTAEICEEEEAKPTNPPCHWEVRRFTYRVTKEPTKTNAPIYLFIGWDTEH